MEPLRLLKLTGGGSGRRIGDCRRKRRLCFAENPAKAKYYARHRAARFARRFFGGEPPRRGA